MSYSDIEVPDVNTLLSTVDPVIIDMRDHQSQSRGRLPSAVSVSDETIRQLIRRRRTNPAVLVYCYHGNQSPRPLQLPYPNGLEQCAQPVWGLGGLGTLSTIY